MSYSDFTIGRQIFGDYDSDDFYGVIQGAMRIADDMNLEKLRNAFPGVLEELQSRYNAPGGKLPSD